MPRVLKLEAPADLAMPKGGDDAARKFYGKLLGLRERMKPPGERGVWFDVGGTEVRVRSQDAPPAPSPDVRARFHVDNVEAFRQAAVAQRVRTWDAIAISGTRAVVLGDPFGNRVELREYRTVGGERVIERDDARDG